MEPEGLGVGNDVFISVGHVPILVLMKCHSGAVTLATPCPRSRPLSHSGSFRDSVAIVRRPSGARPLAGRRRRRGSAASPPLPATSCSAAAAAPALPSQAEPLSKRSVL